jgi:LAGLIDADG endonuclease
LKFSNQYLAGFFDGEGCIGLRTNRSTVDHQTYSLVVCLPQLKSKNSTELFDGLKNSFGGRLYLRTWAKRRRPCYQYVINGAEAIKLLQELRPYLVFKAAQADVAIRWFQSRSVWRPKNGRQRFQWSAKDAKVALKLKSMKRKVI